MKKEMIKYLSGVLLTVLCLGGAGAVYWNWMFHRPYRLEADCRGMGIDGETIKRWEEREKNGSLGVVNMAGWKTGDQQTAVSVSTGRKQRAKVIMVYGSMGLVEKAEILDGRYGMDVEGDFCVLSKDLADHLFGSVYVAGECIKLDNKHFIVAGVIDKEEDFLMIPMEEGNAESLAVVFEGAAEARDRLGRLLEE